jgi:hypothetical protein
MGDMADSLGAMKAVQQFERTQKRNSAPEQLTAASISFKSFNDGAHLRLYAKGVNIDFCPGTGRWKVCGDKKSRHGIESLLAFCT